MRKLEFRRWNSCIHSKIRVFFYLFQCFWRKSILSFKHFLNAVILLSMNPFTFQKIVRFLFVLLNLDVFVHKCFISISYSRLNSIRLIKLSDFIVCNDRYSFWQCSSFSFIIINYYFFRLKIQWSRHRSSNTFFSVSRFIAKT